MSYFIRRKFNKQSILAILLILVATHMHILHATEDSKLKPKHLILSPHEEVKLWNTTKEKKDKAEFETAELGFKEKVPYISDKDINKSKIDIISRTANIDHDVGSMIDNISQITNIDHDVGSMLDNISRTANIDHDVRSMIDNISRTANIDHDVGSIDGSFWWETPSVGNFSSSIPFEVHNSNDEDHNSFYYDIQPGSNNSDNFGFVPETSEPYYDMSCNKTCSTRNSSLIPNYKPLESCGCDEECGARDDCCEDAPSEYQQRPRNQYIECFIEREYDTRGKYGIRRCPDNTPKTLSDKCLKNVVQEDYTYILDIPVVSKKTGIYYKNIYCAHCNGDNADIKDSIFEFSCPNYPVPLFADVHFNMIYQPGQLKWTQNISKTDIVHKSNISKDFWEIIKNEGKRKPLECELYLANFQSISQCVKYINNCPISFKNDSIKQRCQAHTYIVVDDIYQIFYKNRHCAICNNVTEKDISCILDFSHLRTIFTAPDLTELFNTIPTFNNKTHDSLTVNSTLIDNENIEKSILTACLFSISLICMIAHMVIFFILPEKRNVPSMNLFCLTLSLFIAEFLFLTFSLSTDNYIGCYTTAMIMYLAFTAAFFWMNVMSFDIYKTFSSRQYSIKSRKLFIKYSVYAWGCATLFGLIVFTVDMALPEDSNFKPDFGNNYCWFNRSHLNSLIIFFILPSSLIIISNLIIYIKTVFVIYKQFQDAKFATSPPTSSTSLEEIRYESNGSLSISNERNVNGNRLPKKTPAEIQKEKDRRLQWHQFVVFSKLAVIMGLSWIFGIFFAITGSKIIGLVFTITTSLQGTFIFVIFDFKFNIFQEIKNKWSYACTKK